MTLRVLEIAEAEVLDAALWYEERSDGLGATFLAEYEASLTTVAKSPSSCARMETLRTDREIRRCVLRRFPYYIVYEILPDVTVVLAVAHVSRRPNYWLNREG